MTPRWRRKAIPRSDSPWGEEYSGRGLYGAPRGQRRNPRRSSADDRGGWLIGPTWLYVALALVVFAVAAVVAVVQATGSESTPGPVAEEQAAVAEEQAAVVEEQSQPAEPARQSAEPAVTLATDTDEPAQAAEAEAVEPEEQVQSRAEQVDPPDQQQQPTEAEIEAEESDNPLSGFILPIRGACVTEFEGHLPSASRAYRNHGVHEGLDFYQWASCTTVNVATEVVAAKAGVVIRADVDYVDITPADWERFQAANWEGEAILDELRGRQVWIDHGRGVVTRYAHLSEIAEGIVAGVEVQQGQLIGYPGESGQREVYANPGKDIHLHFEIRVGQGWLGQGMTPLEARDLYLHAFGRSD